MQLGRLSRSSRSAVTVKGSREDSVNDSAKDFGKNAVDESLKDPAKNQTKDSVTTPSQVATKTAVFSRGDKQGSNGESLSTIEALDEDERSSERHAEESSLDISDGRARGQAVSSAFFDEMDELDEALCVTRESMAEAVAREAYGEASALKATLESLEARDTTLEIERAFAAAVAEERYDDAAKLRDEGGVRMLGWWVGREGVDDMAGHLVEVRRGVGRYVGVALDPNVVSSGGDPTAGNDVFEVFYEKKRTTKQLDGVGEKNQQGGDYATQATVFDGRMIFLLDEEDDEDDIDVDDGIRTVEDLLNMDAEEVQATVDDDDEDEDDGGFHAVDVVRQPVDVEWVKKDMFILRMDGMDAVDDLSVLDDMEGEMAELERMVMDVVNVHEDQASSLSLSQNRESREERGREERQRTKPIQITYRRLGEVEKDELYLGSFGTVNFSRSCQYVLTRIPHSLI